MKRNLKKFRVWKYDEFFVTAESEKSLRESLEKDWNVEEVKDGRKKIIKNK